MKRWCPQGTVYSQMDAMLECAAALVRGVKVNGVHECEDCGGWHLGQRKRLDPICPATGKRIFGKRKAEQLVAYSRKRFAEGHTQRTEIAAYQCKKKYGCGQWHVTSMDQEGFK